MWYLEKRGIKKTEKKNEMSPIRRRIPVDCGVWESKKVFMKERMNNCVKCG